MLRARCPALPCLSPPLCPPSPHPPPTPTSPHPPPPPTSPVRYELSNALLFTIYNEVYEQVCAQVSKSKYVSLSTDGWSRTQGGQHVYNFLACSWEFAYFLDMFISSREKVRAGHCMASCTRARAPPAPGAREWRPARPNPPAALPDCLR